MEPMQGNDDSAHGLTTEVPLVQALNRLRDALTSMALELREVQFEQDSSRRAAIVAEFEHLLARVNAPKE
jgi:hypothetical protein